MPTPRDRRTGFSRRRQNMVFIGYVLAVAGALIGAVLLVVSRFDPPMFAALRMAAASVTAPISSGVAGAGRAVWSIPQEISTHFLVRGENERLRAVVARDRALVLRARSIAYENRRLRTLLALRDREAGTVAAARLVSSSATSGRRFALIDAGRLQGVQPGMPVRGPMGLIGRVVETGPWVARVLLISDPNSIVPVRRTRDGLPAIAVGRGDGRVDLRSVSVANARFQPGDLFVTTGTGGIYAPNVPVARVEQPGSDTVIADTMASPDTLDVALVQRIFLPIPTSPAPSVPAKR
ncbi:rod shape-determining protein MreC [Sphingomonas gellani]|uniref:Cell shape-determining protein MreC n=1 Tax=Sphingomonas gellani TaxID=1166340 RepID=A0A1H7ZE37_9SPHN|nr:rod shape-determining protein MreC [Sphingomonas gellani]SEM55717.1 rod shape-determining protein MreC [Sphingomonas gellani]